MKFLKKLKSSNFWVSMISAIVLILQAVFNVEIKAEYLNQIILGILGILVMTGIVSDTSNNEVMVKQEFDFDKLKDTITSMFTQVSATLQTDINNIMSQLNNATQNEIIDEEKKDAKIESENIDNQSITESQQKDNMTIQKNTLVNSSGKPIVLREKMPEIQGVIVVADGAGIASVRLEIIKAVQALLKVPNGNIEVLKRS